MVSGLTAALALGAAPASATTEYIQGTVTNRYTYATNPHSVTVGGSNIYLQITDVGVPMKVFWYKCGQRDVHGTAVDVGDGSRHKLGTNFKAGAQICLAYVGDIAESGVSLPWRGKLTLNVFS
ncbi:hypothetical protein ASE09_33225 [Streptomyces sp. Root66D1]|nr:hypothetical protein ASD33_33245 [Streptomyces sp. Root1304]KRA86655.1 hypothetical protein ASE09_33225 [Streptomyces sp. Root66D1]